MTNLTSLIPIIEKYSPNLAKLLPPPFGSLLSYGLEKIFDTDANNLVNKIQQDPNAEFKIKQLEIAHQDLINQLKSSDFQANLNDIEGARQRDLKQTQILGRRDWVMDVIALMIIGGFFFMLFVIAFTSFDKADHDVLFMLIGQLCAGFIGVLSFFFGNIRKP